MKTTRNVLFIVLTCAFTLGFSQRVRVPNLSGLYIPQVYPLINPSTIFFTSEKGNANLGIRQGISSFKVFEQNNLHVNRLSTKDSVRYQGWGIRLLNDQAGDYIGINRLSVVYGTAIQLSEDSKLSMAVAPTYISYRKLANTFGDVDVGFNLDLGLSLGIKSTEFGLSINQIAPLRLQVIDEVDSLKQQLTVYANQAVDLGSDFDLSLYSVWFLNRSLENEFVFGGLMTYKEKFRFGTSYGLNRDISFSMGVRELPLKSWGDGFGLDFVFSIPSLAQKFRNRNTVEWILNYDF